MNSAPFIPEPELKYSYIFNCDESYSFSKIPYQLKLQLSKESTNVNHNWLHELFMSVAFFNCVVFFNIADDMFNIYSAFGMFIVIHCLEYAVNSNNLVPREWCDNRIPLSISFISKENTIGCKMRSCPWAVGRSSKNWPASLMLPRKPVLKYCMFLKCLLSFGCMKIKCFILHAFSWWAH